MRELKFRAWDGERILQMNQQYGLQPQKQITDDAWTRFWESLFRCQEQLTLMQYTGLKDKNGVEIYEGDVLYGPVNPTDFPRKCKIEWHNSSWQMFTKGYWREAYKLGPTLEVIGNIYSNPELLK